MNSVLTMQDVGLALCSERLEGILSFLVSRSKDSSRSLAPSTNDVFSVCLQEIHHILRTVIDTKTHAEYSREFNRLFPKYVALNLSISHFATATIPRDAVERLTRESICEMEADFREKGVAAFGTAVREQALFTVWTLRKINEIVIQINATKLPPSKRKEDHKHCAEFNMHAFRAQFSLDALGMALDIERPVYPEVSDELMDGLRSMVNAYAHARKGLDLRAPSESPAFSTAAIDDGDAALLEVAFAEASDLDEGV
jgi:hypothetical protein